MISSESRDAGNPHVRFDERGEETWLGGKVSEAPTDGESRRNTPKTATASWLRLTRLSSTLQQEESIRKKVCKPFTHGSIPTCASIPRVLNLLLAPLSILEGLLRGS